MTGGAKYLEIELRDGYPGGTWYINDVRLEERYPWGGVAYRIPIDELDRRYGDVMSVGGSTRRFPWGIYFLFGRPAVPGKRRSVYVGQSKKGLDRVKYHTVSTDSSTENGTSASW